ncbi:uncharacterized protein LOC130371477 [Gadus chalcogrammus]|uniref:uncharacterized protein LOC130371477 n=1 Tax=Gadus chalcogrammus TaxID=1042646 RepID=UPI0024C47CD3|nr:uncharacterized protein LOC130371477 [Gadus chalcogrammus]
MNILIVFALPLYMASLVRSAPLPGLSGDNFRSLVDTDFYNNVDISLSILRKIVHAIPETHNACLTSKAFELNSTKGEFKLVAERIGIPVSPVLHLNRTLEHSTMESSLVTMSEGLLLHQSLLSNISTHLGPQDTVTELLTDIRDLLFHIRKLLKDIKVDSAEQPAAPWPGINLSDDFDVQVTTHVTLQQLQGFGQDMERILRRVAQANEDVTQPTDSEQL